MTTDIKPGLSAQLSDDLSRCIILTGTPIEHSSSCVNECEPDSYTFMSTHTLDMMFIQCDSK